MEDSEEVQPNPYESPTHFAPARIKKSEGTSAAWWLFAVSMAIAETVFLSFWYGPLLRDLAIMGRAADEVIGAVAGVAIFGVIIIALGLGGSGMWRGFRSQFFRKYRPRRVARIVGGLSFLPAHIVSLVVLHLLDVPAYANFTFVFAFVSVFLISGMFCVEVEAKLALWFNL